MNKDFGQDKLLSFKENKQIKVLYDLARFIEDSGSSVESNHFKKLKKYHTFLEGSSFSLIQKLNKEFAKVVKIDHQFQIYIMNLERLMGQSCDEYNFLVTTNDNNINDVQKFNIICLLDSVRSAHNVGAMFRNAECFGVEKIILTGLSPTPDSVAVQKTAMNCELEVPWNYIKDPLEVISYLKKQGYQIWSIETARESIDLNELKNVPSKLVIIFGHEQFGISNDILKVSDKIVSIRLFGKKNSLNVSVCQGIILNQLSFRLNL